MHDAAYKTLFSHPRLVRDLLQGFVPEPWTDALDLDSLEKLPTDFTSDDLRQRQADTVWRIRFRAEWLYVLVLLEFQSTEDRYMALRILVYTALLHQDLIRRGAVGPHGVAPAGAAHRALQRRASLEGRGRCVSTDCPGQRRLGTISALAALSAP